MKPVMWAACLLLGGCAASGTDTVDTSRLESSESLASAAAEEGRGQREVRIVRELEISEFAEGKTACRREAPLGSRISVTRCYETGVGTAQNAALDQLARQELETLRQRQMFIEQQRQAREAAIRMAR